MVFTPEGRVLRLFRLLSEVSDLAGELECQGDDVVKALAPFKASMDAIEGDLSRFQDSEMDLRYEEAEDKADAKAFEEYVDKRLREAAAQRPRAMADRLGL